MSIELDTKELKQSDNFVYVGGVISVDSSCHEDVVRRIGIASGVVRNLDDIWKSSSSSQNFYGAFYKVVRPTAPYNMRVHKTIKT